MSQTEHWQIEVETPIGLQSGTLEFTRKGDAIEGRLFNDSGELKLLSGTIEGESLRWEVELPAGGSQELRFSYALELPAKREVVGGNRRD